MRTIGSFFVLDLSWLRTDWHSSWWQPFDEEALNFLRKQTSGRPEDYQLVGREPFREVECYVVERLGPRVRRLYIGVADRRLYGLSELSLDSSADWKPIADEISRQHGGPESFANNAQWSQWLAGLSEADRSAVEQAYWKGTRPLMRPYVEHRLADYREVGPGRWFPMVQGYALFGETAPGKTIVTGERRFKAVEVRVDEPLPDELFTVELREGVQVYDRTHEPALSYRYKKEMTDEEWAQITAQAKSKDERSKAREAQMSALSGKPAPAFPEKAQWIN